MRNGNPWWGSPRDCKECGKRICRGKSEIAWYRWVLRLCRYCYKWKFPKRKRHGPPLRQGSERLLSWDDKRRREKKGFNPLVWSPEFRQQMLDLWKAQKRGELKC